VKHQGLDIDGFNMANAEQVAVLKKVHGTEWNNWRKARSVVTPDLTGANRGRVHINGVDLSGANLRGADLVVWNDSMQPQASNVHASVKGFPRALARSG
jgi:uncharacterized protein YjbI with pentapeptide repeats